MNENCCEKCTWYVKDIDGKTLGKSSVCGIDGCPCHQSEKPQPEQWFEELEMYKKSATEAIMTFDPKHTFCTICGTDPEKLITHLKEVLDSVPLAQKEQMLEAYTYWLHSNGYADADVYAEKPTAWERYIEEKGKE